MRVFHLSARQGYDAELLTCSQAPGATWGRAGGAVPPAQQAVHPLDTGSKGPGMLHSGDT